MRDRGEYQIVKRKVGTNRRNTPGKEREFWRRLVIDDAWRINI